MDLTHQFGGSIAAAEFINEPSFPSAAGLPPSYDGAAYGRDAAIFRAFLRKASPETKLLGPGSVGEGTKFVPIKLLESKDMLAAMPPNSVDVFTWHFYGTVSERCASMMGPAAGTSPGAALSGDWLDRTLTVEAFYEALRDQYDPHAPMWVTETGQAACGGDRWAATFLDSFRYLNQLGALAQKNVQVVMHNTLAASDYGLINERTLTPRPNYWAALLWHRTMGSTVLDPGSSPSASVKLYAHCTVDRPGSVTLLALNLDRAQAATLKLPVGVEKYTLTAPELESHSAMLNGHELSLTAEGKLPQMSPTNDAAGTVTLPAASISFLVLPAAKNAACN